MPANFLVPLASLSLSVRLGVVLPDSSSHPSSSSPGTQYTMDVTAVLIQPTFEAHPGELLFLPGPFALDHGAPGTQVG